MAKAKILIVDDEPDIVRALTMRLRAAGYDVITASDALTGTELALHASPDAVILDIGMPCGSGHVIAERLQNNVQTMSIPIIFLTARTSSEDRKRAESVQAAGYLTKPFKAQDLLDTLARTLSGEISVGP